MFLFLDKKGPERYEKFFEARVREAYRRRVIVLPRIKGRREKVRRHLRVVGRMIWRTGWKGMLGVG